MGSYMPNIYLSYEAQTKLKISLYWCFCSVTSPVVDLVFSLFDEKLQSNSGLSWTFVQVLVSFEIDKSYVKSYTNAMRQYLSCLFCCNLLWRVFVTSWSQLIRAVYHNVYGYNQIECVFFLPTLQLKPWISLCQRSIIFSMRTHSCRMASDVSHGISMPTNSQQQYRTHTGGMPVPVTHFR